MFLAFIYNQLEGEKGKIKGKTFKLLKLDENKMIFEVDSEVSFSTEALIVQNLPDVKPDGNQAIVSTSNHLFCILICLIGTYDSWCQKFDSYVDQKQTADQNPSTQRINTIEKQNTTQTTVKENEDTDSSHKLTNRKKKIDKRKEVVVEDSDGSEEEEQARDSVNKIKKDKHRKNKKESKKRKKDNQEEEQDMNFDIGFDFTSKRKSKRFVPGNLKGEAKTRAENAIEKWLDSELAEQ